MTKKEFYEEIGNAVEKNDTMVTVISIANKYGMPYEIDDDENTCTIYINERKWFVDGEVGRYAEITWRAL